MARMQSLMASDTGVSIQPFYEPSEALEWLGLPRGSRADLLKEQPSLQAISLVGLAVLMIGVGLWGLNWARRSLVVRAVGDVVLDLRTRAFRAAAEHDLSFYDQFSSGRIVSRITSDTNDFGQLVVIVTDVGSQIVQAIILGVVLFRTDLKLSLMLMLFLPVIFGVEAGFRAMARRQTSGVSSPLL